MYSNPLQSKAIRLNYSLAYKLLSRVQESTRRRRELAQCKAIRLNYSLVPERVITLSRTSPRHLLVHLCTRDTAQFPKKFFRNWSCFKIESTPPYKISTSLSHDMAQFPKKSRNWSCFKTESTPPLHLLRDFRLFEYFFPEKRSACFSHCPPRKFAKLSKILWKI